MPEVLKTDDLVAQASERTGVSKKDAKAVLNAVTDIMMDEIVGGKVVPVGKIGRISYRLRGARTGKNPATGKPIAIPACNVPRISWGSALKKAVAEK